MPSRNTITYLAGLECETCGFSENLGAEEVRRARRLAKRHAETHPGHRVLVETGKTTSYGAPDA